MVAIKKGDFVEIEYTGKTEEGIVFDTTDEKSAKENGCHNPNMKYGPVIILVGDSQILAALDESAIGKETGSAYTIELPPEKAFGKKDAKLIQLIPTARFAKDNVAPSPGMTVSIDSALGVIKTVTGGRTLVDFNHPIAGKRVVYEIKINRKIEDDGAKIKAYVGISLNLMDVEVGIKDGSAEIKTAKEIPKEISQELGKKLKQAVPSIKEFKFTVKE